jgi:hypothetical protein
MTSVPGEKGVRKIMMLKTGTQVVRQMRPAKNTMPGNVLIYLMMPLESVR